ncbi:unnamed protein product [Cercospora beticola]|nr:unnamed protein product [Cercospora beticola]
MLQLDASQMDRISETNETHYLSLNIGLEYLWAVLILDGSQPESTAEALGTHRLLQRSVWTHFHAILPLSGSQLNSISEPQETIRLPPVVRMEPYLHRFDIEWLSTGQYRRETRCMLSISGGSFECISGPFLHSMPPSRTILRRYWRLLGFSGGSLGCIFSPY